MSDIKFSIIVPHYNDVDGILRLAVSLPKRSDVEIIVVDDNSDFEELTKLQKFIHESDLNLFLYRNDSGYKGAGAARNIGIRKSTGDYIIFSDSDDYFVEHAFKVIDTTLSKSEKNFDIYYFKPTSRCLISGRVSDRHVSYSKLIEDFLGNKNQNIRYKFYVPWSKVYLRKYIVENKFKFDQVIASNDVMFSLKSAMNARIKASRNVIYCVTRGVGTLTVNFSKMVLMSRLNVSLEESKYIYDKNINVEKNSVVSLVQKSKFNISNSGFWSILKSYKQGYIVLFPKSYIGYLKDPRKLYKRLLSKKSSVDEKKYRN